MLSSPQVSEEVEEKQVCEEEMEPLVLCLSWVAKCSRRRVELMDGGGKSNRRESLDISWFRFR